MTQQTQREALTTGGLLSSQRRVYVLLTLREVESPMRLPILVYETALREVDSPNDVTEEQLERVEITMRHVHLPKLEEHEMIQYDPENQQVSLADDIEELEAILEAIF
ncbi:DUF7344 domain-containing protein [Haloprofundus halobius]|uniref:DUF7344 domain-containing protein n=1 Tax=Haloprofundus halobius TaxID=2876194 RepID=UPI001CCB7698|nr:hypothetical protein [Haloprofundus halobius]